MPRSFLLLPLSMLAFASAAFAQPAIPGVEPAALTARTETSIPPTVAPPTNKPGGNTFTPTWETQKGARTFTLNIPAPRGQIVDRNGLPLAVTRVSHNLALSFPTPLEFNERQVLQFAEQQVLLARSLTGRQISLKQNDVLEHYKNRGAMPMFIAQGQDLKAQELERIRTQKPEYLTVQPIYLREYPNGKLACHIVGYASRNGKYPDGPIQNDELLWPNTKGREGLEGAFDEQLQGKMGQFNISFDNKGRKATEQITIPPQPGSNVVTTIDLNLQRLCEESLAKSAKRGALVIIDPSNGDILAMASWPTFDPNLFSPAISPDEYALLRDDPDNPLIPRAFRSAYPPGSTFKILVGIAALQSGKVGVNEEFGCPASMEIGNLRFRNWKKSDAGSMNFAEALTQSCNTWFYQIGMKIGAQPIIDYSHKFGLGSRTGIPLASEAEGNIPTNEYMLKVHKRKLMSGDLASYAIGQGDVLVTPLQMAQAMAAVGNGGTLFQTRLVKQVQSIDDRIVSAYNVRVRNQVHMDKNVVKAVRKGMLGVVESGHGTAGRAHVEGMRVAGKTGTAQWGPKKAERTAAWFAGIAPVDDPRYAFAVLYETDVEDAGLHGGTVAAPLIANVLKRVVKEEKDEKKRLEQFAKEAEESETEDEDGTTVRRAMPVEQQEPDRSN
ncbi:MAG: penicillin-binding protein 2 [Chthoniobacteraceae bacterium]